MMTSTPITIGSHRLLAGDLTAGAVATLMGGERAAVVYSDPPWGPGNLQFWATAHARGSIPRETWPRFLDAFCGAVVKHTQPEAPIFVEMGCRWVDDLDAAMRAWDLGLLQRWTITYGPKSRPLPNTLNLYGPTRVALALPDPPHGEPVTRAALGAVRAVLLRPGAIVLDPCTGFGMTARITHRLGGIFRGSELNPVRLERTADWLRKAVARVR
jgi:hypothetical protein